MNTSNLSTSCAYLLCTILSAIHISTPKNFQQFYTLETNISRNCCIQFLYSLMTGE